MWRFACITFGITISVAAGVWARPITSWHGFDRNGRGG
jgi:hypothetical protein